MTDLKKQFGKVAVLMGGWSAEREVSLLSGQAVVNGLSDAGVDVTAIDLKKADVRQLNGFDRVFNVLHGRGGEDGVVQGMLEYMGVDYTGTGILGSALAMDKIRTKEIWLSKNLQTPAFRVVSSIEESLRAIDELGLPVVVKPALEGSSIGISKVEKNAEINAAFELANSCNSAVMIEQWIEGEEFTASILNDEVLPLIKLQTPNQFYDYQAKYVLDDTEYVCPCGLAEEKEAALGDVALKAFNAISAKGWGRIDFMLDENGQYWLIEANTVPGMTSHSLVPMAAKQAGYSFNQLVVEILKTSMDRYV